MDNSFKSLQRKTCCQENQSCGDFEVDEVDPGGVFFREGGEKRVSRLAGSVQQS
jgi:hypothetical protein